MTQRMYVEESVASEYLDTERGGRPKHTGKRITPKEKGLLRKSTEGGYQGQKNRALMKTFVERSDRLLWDLWKLGLRKKDQTL